MYGEDYCSQWLSDQNTTLYNNTQYDTTQYDTAQYDTTQYGMGDYTTQYGSSTPWYKMGDNDCAMDDAISGLPDEAGFMGAWYDPVRKTPDEADRTRDWKDPVRKTPDEADRTRDWKDPVRVAKTRAFQKAHGLRIRVYHKPKPHPVVTVVPPRQWSLSSSTDRTEDSGICIEDDEEDEDSDEDSDDDDEEGEEEEEDEEESDEEGKEDADQYINGDQFHGSDRSSSYCDGSRSFVSSSHSMKNADEGYETDSSLSEDDDYASSLSHNEDFPSPLSNDEDYPSPLSIDEVYTSPVFEDEGYGGSPPSSPSEDEGYGSLSSPTQFEIEDELYRLAQS